MQVEYYFSVQNLCRDMFLRSKMAEGGWIPVAVIAGFNRVRMLTPDLAVIIASLQNSTIVELSADGALMRARQNWQNWVLPAEQRDPSAQAIIPRLSLDVPGRGAERYAFARITLNYNRYCLQAYISRKGCYLAGPDCSCLPFLFTTRGFMKLYNFLARCVACGSALFSASYCPAA